MSAELTARQQREVDYHRGYARTKATKAREPVSLRVARDEERRWWNAYWHTYTLLRRHDLRGLTVLVPGCGFGEDAIRIASLGAEVHAFDISPDVVDVARERARRLGCENLHIDVMPSEAMAYADDTFDLVFFLDILHHVDIAATCAEVRRVARPGALVIGDELYTSRFLQRLVRKSYAVDKLIYPRLVRFIYGTATPYITEDERKIDGADLDRIAALCPDLSCTWFNLLVGRVLPDSSLSICQSDRLLLRLMGGLGRLLAGRVVFEGHISK